MSVQIPLHQSRIVVVAHAIVDEADLPDLQPYRWLLDQNGYARRYEPRSVENASPSSVLMHRAILGLSVGDGLTVDHINRDRIDNRRANLRPATRAQNNQNLGSLPGSTSRFRGVCFHKASGLWQARVKLRSETSSLGYFRTEEEAAEAAAAFRAEHMPFSAEALAS